MFVAAPADAVDLSSARRVLVTKLRHHGDVLLASPVFSALRRHGPHLEIDALVYLDTAPMLAGHPAIEQLHTIDRQWKRRSPIGQARAEWSLLRRLRARQYDVLIHLTDHRRGAWLARALRPRTAVAPRRGIAGQFWERSFSHLYVEPKGSRPRHTVELNLDALRRLGIPIAEADKPLTMVPGDAAQRRVDAVCAERGLAGQRFVVVHPGSRWLFKALPPASVADFISQLAARGVRVAITGAPDAQERGYVDAILAQVRGAPVDLAGALSLPELAALISRADAFVGVDSAPMHIAAAVGTPVVAAFGPSGEQQWGPWRTSHRIVASRRHPCRPCGNDGCGGGKVSECLTTLDSNELLVALDEVLLPAPGRPG